MFMSECYTIFLTLSQALEKKRDGNGENKGSEEDGDESMCRAAELQCDKIRLVEVLMDDTSIRLDTSLWLHFTCQVCEMFFVHLSTS